MAVHAVSQPPLTLQSVSSEDLITDTATGPKTTVLVRVVIRTDERNDALLEKVVSTLSLEPGVSAVQWAVHEDDPADD
ncbi:hypothetical protein R3Q06_33580 [Rhodococcus erythropolis]|nr:hypothetical protein [Rhodococcus erythropolis]MDV6278365.1 hypothetical protein [Rhodococcus erythropolis]